MFILDLALAQAPLDLTVLDKKLAASPMSECPIADPLRARLAALRELAAELKACERATPADCRPQDAHVRAEYDAVYLSIEHSLRDEGDMAMVPPGSAGSFRMAPLAFSSVYDQVMVARDDAAAADPSRFVVRLLEVGQPPAVVPRPPPPTARERETGVWQSVWSIPDLSPPYAVEVSEEGAGTWRFDVVSRCEVQVVTL